MEPILFPPTELPGGPSMGDSPIILI